MTKILQMCFKYFSSVFVDEYENNNSFDRLVTYCHETVKAKG